MHLLVFYEDAFNSELEFFKKINIFSNTRNSNCVNLQDRLKESDLYNSF